MGTYEVEAGDHAVPLSLHVDNSTGGVTGLAPTVAIRLIATGTAQYLDWADQTFKTSGWTLQYKPLPEVGRGLYQLPVWDLGALGKPAGTKLSAEYHVDNGAGLVGDDADVLTLVSTGADAKLARKFATNRLEASPGNPGALVLYDDDATTPLRTYALRDATGGAVTSPGGSPAKRGAGA